VEKDSRSERYITDIYISSMILFSIVYTIAVVTYFYFILSDLTLCFIIAGILFPYALVTYRRYAALQKVKKIENQFAEALRFISSSLSAGMTIENSFYEFVSKSDTYSRRDLSIISEEFRKITGQMDLHIGLTDAFADFAKRSGSSDIKVFSVALSGICRTGGDLVGLVRNTASSLRIKREAEDEIDLIISGPKYNHRIITAMPLLIIFMMRFISPDYMSALHSGIGKVVAVVSAVVIILSFIIGNKLSDIQL